MSKVRRTVRWFRDMSVLAEDEQRRSGHPEIEVEHLFLALLSIGGPVTEALAEGGVALASAREAFANVHARHLVALGVEVPTPSKTARRIPASKARGGFVYREGVRTLLEDAANQPLQDVALFRALLAEPSGHIREVLRELDVDPDVLLLSLGPSEDRPAVEDGGSGYRRFLPAPAEDVWALVSDPDRWLEWNGFEFDRVEIADGGVLRAHARERRLDGKPTRIKPQFQVSDYVVSRSEPPRTIVWERSFPMRPAPWGRASASA